MDIEFSYQWLPDLERKYANAPAVIREEQARGMTRAVLLIEHDAKAAAPFHTGHLRRSITHQVTTASNGVIGIVGTNVPYAAPVEDGRRAGAPMPPAGSLLVWMKSKGIDPANEYVLRRAIGKRGIKAKPYLRPAYHNQEAEIKRELTTLVVARILKRLQVGK